MLHNYQYKVRIAAGSGVLQTAEIADVIPDSTDIAIISRVFANYDECETKLGELMSELSSRESIATDKNFVIVAKKNPNIYGGKINEGEVWENNTIIRFFIADTEPLKKLILNFSIDGRIDSLDGTLGTSAGLPNIVQ